MPFHASLVLILVALGIGSLVGGVGIGGMFLPPALMAVTGLDIHHSVAMSLFSFIFTGIAGTGYFHARGNVDWRAARPLCAGAALTGWAGAWFGHHLGTAAMSLVLAAVIVGAGLHAVAAGGNAAFPMPDSARERWCRLVAVGAVTGLLSGLTGVGGPVLSVPLMAMCGYPMFTAIGVGQALQVVGALSGSLVNLHYLDIDYGLAAFVAAFEIAGALLGAWAIHRVRAALVRRLVGALCLVAGCGFIVRVW